MDSHGWSERRARMAVGCRDRRAVIGVEKIVARL
jgi:hypothetical protein